MESSSEKDLLNQQIKRIVTALFKDFLSILQEIQQENFANTEELKRKFPPEFVNSVETLDFVKYSRLRKHILDGGNDSLREISLLIDMFSIKLK